MMEETQLSGTDLKVSRLCLGTANLGLKQSELEAFELLDAFVERGGLFIDSARVYSDWIPGEKGRCERILGEWFRARPGLRDRVVIATKGGHYEWSDKSRNRVNPVSVRHDIELSLRSLGLERLPLWYLHRDSMNLPVEEIVEFMQVFVEEGKVGFLGVANWSGSRLAQANAYAKEKGLHGFVANQPEFSLGVWAKSDVGGDPTLARLDVDGWRWHREEGTALVPYSAQTKGFFSKVLESTDEGGRESFKTSPFYTERNLAVAKVVGRLAGEHGCNANAIVLAYLLRQPFPVYPIIGAYSIELIEDSMKSLEIGLTGEELRELELAAGIAL